MSLACWLPLLGNTNNQGLGGHTLIGSPASWSTNGKIGKCATFNGNTSNIIYNNTTDFNYTDNFSFCMWINHNFTGSTAQYAFTVGRVDYGDGRGYGVQIINSTNIRFWFGTRIIDMTCSANEWHHIAMTVSGTSIKIYKDGILYATSTTATLPTYSDGNGLGIGCFHHGGGNIYPYYGSINDFRIYSHTLSSKEISEISHGLVCHYPLKSQYETGQVNKYSGDFAEGYVYISSNFTRTKLADERGYNYKLSYTGTGSNKWFSMTAPRFSFTKGKTYYYSCKVRCHSANFQLELRAARIENDYVTRRTNVLNADGQWHEYVVYQRIDETVTIGGSTITCNPGLEFYTEGLATANKVFTADFDIKDIQVIESDCYVPFIDNSMASTVVSDCSGYGNDGTTNGVIAWSDNSPRYSGSYDLNGTNYIKTNYSASMSELSCSFWVKPNSQNGGYAIIASNYSYPATGFWIAVNCESSGLWFYNGRTYVKGNALLSNDVWYHGCFTYDNGIGKWYLNGELVTTADISSEGTSLKISKLSIGNSYSGSSWNTKFYGNISDFRLYATCLSDSDVKSLYQVSASIDRTGILYCGEVMEN